MTLNALLTRCVACAHDDRMISHRPNRNSSLEWRCWIQVCRPMNCAFDGRSFSQLPTLWSIGLVHTLLAPVRWWLPISALMAPVCISGDLTQALEWTPLEWDSRLAHHKQAFEIRRHLEHLNIAFCISMFISRNSRDFIMCVTVQYNQKAVKMVQEPSTTPVT